MNQFDRHCIGYFPFSESEILIFKENIQKFFREIDLFDFTSFLPWTFLIFLAHCGYIGTLCTNL